MSGARHVVNTYDPVNGDLKTTTVTAYDPVTHLPTNLVTRYSYDSMGRLTKMTDPRGDVSMISYTTIYDYTGNTFGQPTTVTRWITAASNAVEVYGYDGHGNQTSYQDANGRQTGYSVDVLGRRVTTTQPTVNGSQPVSTWAYDERGNVTTSVDAAGRTTTYKYDARNRLVAATLPDGSRVESVYDGLGNAISKADGLGNVMQFRYDTKGRLIQTIFADRESSAAAYNGAGQIVRSSDANRNVTTYSYDRLGRVMSMQEPSPNGLVAGRTWTYQYDAVGNRTQETLVVANDSRVTTFAYDTLNRLVKRTDPNPMWAIAGVSTDITPFQFYKYDSVGNITESTQGGVETSDARQTSTMQYDGLNRMIHEVKPDGGAWDYTYDAVGNRTSVSILTPPIRRHAAKNDSVYLRRLEPSVGYDRQSWQCPSHLTGLAAHIVSLRQGGQPAQHQAVAACGGRRNVAGSKCASLANRLPV